MERAFRGRAWGVATLAAVFVLTLTALLRGVAWLDRPVPGAFGVPVGNLVATASLASLPGIVWIVARRRSLLRRCAAATTVLALAWQPVSTVIAGNVRNNFQGDDGRFEIWLTYTVAVAVAGIVEIGVAMVRGIGRARRRRRGEPG